MLQLLLSTPVVLSLLALAFRSKAFNKATLAFFAVFYFFCCLFLVVHPVPASSYFAVDGLNSIFLLLQSVVFLAALLYSIAFLTESGLTEEWQAYYTALMLLFAFCLTGLTLTTHLGLFWVFLEATTLVTTPFIFAEKKRTSLEAAWKYIFICSLGITFAFIGIILLSLGAKSVESLSFPDLYRQATEINSFWLSMAFVFLLVGFGTKAGLAPLHSWLPDAHSEAPPPVSALLSGALLNGALLGILRMLELMNRAGLGQYPRLLLICMGLMSLVICSVYTLKAVNYKRMLAYSSVEHIGIATLAFGVGGAAVLPGLLHLVGHSLAKASLFLSSGNIHHRYKTRDIAGVTGVLSSDPGTGRLWIAGFLMLSAFPPSPLFYSEFLLLKEMLVQRLYIPALMTALLLTLILLSMGSVVFRMAFGGNSSAKAEHSGYLFLIPQIILLAAAAAAGFIPSEFYAFLSRGVFL
ncbi:MAG: proton-conducting transporter membrane subunit [Candidatus Wallbacteria bacterium]|nr:proton-conducting transporter membrane subunit [Candidatus Wallbacteria bacterium]